MIFIFLDNLVIVVIPKKMVDDVMKIESLQLQLAKQEAVSKCINGCTSILTGRTGRTCPYNENLVDHREKKGISSKRIHVGAQ